MRLSVREVADILESYELPILAVEDMTEYFDAQVDITESVYIQIGDDNVRVIYVEGDLYNLLPKAKSVVDLIVDVRRAMALTGESK